MSIHSQAPDRKIFKKERQKAEIKKSDIQSLSALLTGVYLILPSVIYPLPLDLPAFGPKHTITLGELNH
jgi:hypothetical protein